MMMFMAGFFFGVLIMALLVVNQTKTHDLTILDGKVKWIDRKDRFTMTYQQLLEKYKEKK